MQAGIIAMKHGGFHTLDGLNHLLGNQLDAMVDACQMLGGIKQQSRAGPQQFTGLGRNQRAV